MSVERVLEMANNETNFCSEGYAGELRKALEGARLYLESFEVGRRDVEEQRGLEKE